MKNATRLNYPWITMSSCALALLLVGTELASAACSYNKIINAGYNAIANQCGNANLISVLIQDANSSAPIPDGSSLIKFNNTTQSWEPCNLYTAATHTWSDPAQTLAPGEGAFLINPTATAYTLTISGSDNVDTPIAYCTSPGFYLVSRKIDVACLSYQNITGCPPPVGGENVYKWNGTSFVANHNDEFGAGWGLGEPTAAVGESVFVCLVSGCDQFPSQPPCCVTIATTVTLTWACNCKLQQAPSLSGPWTTVLNGTGQPVTSPYTTTSSGAAGYFRTSCP